MRTYKQMFQTECKLALREADVPIFAFIFPVVIALVLGLVYGKSNTQMLGSTFASASTIGLAAMGLMGLPLTLAGYRDAKILKQLRVTPVRPWMILLVQFSVKFILALFSALFVWLTMALCFGYRMAGNPAVYFGAFVLVAFAVFGIGMVIASLAKDAATAGLLCSVVYFPMLLFSGSTIPLHVLPGGVVRALQVLPLTQGINLLQTAALGGRMTDDPVATLLMTGIGLVATILSVKTFRWE